MANDEHVALLKQGVDAWNKWRAENANIRPNRNGADLHEANLSEVNLNEADLSLANLSAANLSAAFLSRAFLPGADLSGADLMAATLLDTDLTGADITGCRVHGVSAWGLKLERTKQQNLIITSKDEPDITVDNIEVAQFIYLMLHNQKIRDVIDTITSKAVLILGRFTDERKAVLDALREELRKRDYLVRLQCSSQAGHHRNRLTAGPHGPLHHCRPD